MRTGKRNFAEPIDAGKAAVSGEGMAFVSEATSRLASHERAVADPDKYKTVGNALRGGVFRPVDAALEEIEVFFVDFWQKFAVFILVLIAFLLLAAVIPKIVAAVGRRARCWPWTVTQTRYATRVALVALGVMAAFGSVGVSYDVLFLGIVVAGATTSVGAAVSNALCGIVLQSDGTVQPGKILTVRGETGVVVDTDLRHVRVLILERTDDGQGWRRTGRHYYVPNTVLCTEPYEATTFEKPARARAKGEQRKDPGRAAGVFAQPAAGGRGRKLVETQVDVSFENLQEPGEDESTSESASETAAFPATGTSSQFSTALPVQNHKRTHDLEAFSSADTGNLRSRRLPPVHVQRTQAWS